CPEVSALLPGTGSVQKLEQDIIAMFQREWALSGRAHALSSIAIVDEDPQQQYLYPEFILFRELFERHGIRAVIASPEQLVRRDGALWVNELRIDLVYNRLTDFLLAGSSGASLREAWLGNEVLLTPNPQAHALYADKRNLALLS